MITIRRADTDAELEAWRQVRIAVLPNERTGSLAEMRRTATPGSVFLLAELDCEVAGSGAGGRSDLGGQELAAEALLDLAIDRGRPSTGSVRSTRGRSAATRRCAR